MKTIFIVIGIIAAVVVIAGAAGLWWFNSASQPSKEELAAYEYLTEPEMTDLPARKMLVAEVKGDPNVGGKEAFGKLFSELPKIQKEYGGEMSAPIGRWDLSLVDKPKEEWTGVFGIAVSDDAPEGERGEGLKVETWEYGQVAQILHQGSYASEPPTIERLEQFIADEGYDIVGLHEEEYLKGPGMFWAGNPDDYYTIIRYRVQPKSE